MASPVYFGVVDRRMLLQMTSDLEAAVRLC
jgi:hypothetical protein